MNIRNQIAVLLSSEVVNSVLGFAAITVFARQLGATEVGIFFLFQTVVSLIAIPADLGLRGAIEKRISEGQSADTVLTTALLLKAIPISIITVLLLLFSGPTSNYIGIESTQYVVIGIIIKELSGVANHVLIGEMRAEHTATLQVAKQSVWFGGGLIFVYFGLGAVGLIYALLAGWAVKFLLGWTLSSSSLGEPTLSCARSLLEFSKYNSISYVQGELYSWMDIAIIGLFLSQAQVGVYETAWRVAQAVLMVSSAISIAILPQISKWSAKAEWERIENLISNAIFPSIFLTIPAFAGSFLVSDSLLGVLFGREFAAGSSVLIILLAERISHSVFLVFRGSLLGIDQPKLVARAILVTLALNLVLNLLSVQLYGIDGVAFGTAVSFLFCTLLHRKYLSRSLTVKLPYYEIGWCILSAIGMFLILSVLQPYFPFGPTMKLISTVVLGGIVYSIIVVSNSVLRNKLYEILILLFNEDTD